GRLGAAGREGGSEIQRVHDRRRDERSPQSAAHVGGGAAGADFAVDRRLVEYSARAGAGRNRAGGQVRCDDRCRQVPSGDGSGARKRPRRRADRPDRHHSAGPAGRTWAEAGVAQDGARPSSGGQSGKGPYRELISFRITFKSPTKSPYSFSRCSSSG